MAPLLGTAPSRVYFGWWVALAFSPIVFFSTGMRFTVGPFLEPVVADLDLDRGSFSLTTTIDVSRRPIPAGTQPVVGER